MHTSLLLSVAATLGLAVQFGAQTTHGIGFYLEGGEVKCLSEMLTESDLLIGEFRVDPVAKQDESGVKVSVSDPREENVYEKSVDSGKFALTAGVAGEYVYCFANRDNDVRREVRFESHSGVQAKDYSQIATKEDLKPIEVTFRKLREISQRLVKRYRSIRQSEDELYQHSDTSNLNYLLWGILGTAVLIGLGVWQMYHLKSFFQKRKMI